jgi:hypothetical protein
MNSTAIYPNRIEDKNKLEKELGFQEFGNNEIDLYLTFGPQFAKGYKRIVYGDHGPYMEFTKDNIIIELKNKFHEIIRELPKEENSKYYYYWLYPENFNNIKVYWQIKPVHNIPNAPQRDDGKISCFNRDEGYADYKRGYYYVNPYYFEQILS